MAGEREARVRLQLVPGGFVGSIQRIAAESRTALGTIGTAMGNMGMAGLKGVKSTLGNMVGEAKGVLGNAMQFGGLFAGGAAMKKGIDLQEQYRNLAFAIERASGKATTWNEVQRQIEPIAQKTGRSSSELAEAFGDILAETGNAVLAAKVLESIGVHATSSGESVKSLAGVAGVLNEKFGVTAEQMPNALAAMIDMSKKGGVEFEDLQKTLGILGASAKASGLSGEDGMKRMVGMANIGDDAMGSLKKSLSQITMVMDSMATPEMQKNLKQAFNVDVKNKSGEIRDFASVLGDVLVKTKGSREALGKAFKGDTLKLVLGMAAPFQEAFDKTSGSLKDKSEAGLKAFDEALKKAGSSTYTYADATKKAGDRMDDPKRSLARAMEVFAQEFTKPEALDAMKELARSLPKVATLFAKVASFSISNPGAAIAAYAGTRIALGFASSALASAGTAIGTAAATQIRAAAAAAGPWKAAGAAIAIAAAAYLAYELGKQQIDKEADKHRKEASGLAGAAVAGEVAAQQGSRESKEKALKVLKERVESAKTTRSEVENSFLNKATGGAYAGVANTFAGKDTEMAKAEAAIRNLEKSLSGGGKGGEKAAKGFDMAGDAAVRFAQKLDSFDVTKGGTGSNGLPPPGGNTPGAAPR